MIAFFGRCKIWLDMFFHNFCFTVLLRQSQGDGAKPHRDEGLGDLSGSFDRRLLGDLQICLSVVSVV